MSLTDDYLKARKKKTTVSSYDSLTEDYLKTKQKLMENKDEEEQRKQAEAERIRSNLFDDFAPVKSERTWFTSGLLGDGYEKGDVAKSWYATLKDITENVSAGAYGIAENVVDFGATVAGGVGGLFGAKDFQDNMKSFVAKDLIDEEALAKKYNVLGTLINPFAAFNPILGAVQTRVADKILLGDIETDEASFSGEKTDALAQSAGQLAGTVGLQSVGVPWWVTTGVTSFGSGAEEAFKEDASYGEAVLSATIKAGADILTEKLFGGSGLGEKGLINLEPLTEGISNKVVKALADYGLDLASEGSEEVVSSVISRLGSALYKEENLAEILASEEAFDEYLESFIGGAALGGGMNVAKLARSVSSGRDYRTGLTSNEEAVVKKEFENRIADQEIGGKKLSQAEKDKIYDAVVRDMDRGYISTDTIEEVLGGDLRTGYDSLVKESEEFDSLYNTASGQLSKKQQDRLAELEAKNKATPYKKALDEAKIKFSQDVSNLVKDSRLAESYREGARRYEDFQADYSKSEKAKYADAAKKTLDNAVEAGFSNTNAVHDVVDFLTGISGDTGRSFRFANQERITNEFIERQTKEISKLEQVSNKTDAHIKELAELKDMLAKVESGEIKVNGNVSGNEIVLNLDSPKLLNSIAGHEVTHVLEIAKSYDKLRDAVFSYAKSKGVDIDQEIANRKKTYTGVENANAEQELVADLVGDYLFTDYDFVKNLSVQNRNVFQKIYDEIKHLLKMATAGSKEARELERVKYNFDKAYREASQQASKVNSNTKHSLSDSEGKQLSKGQQEYFKDSKMRDENGNLKVMYHGSQDAGFHVFDSSKSDDGRSFFFVDRNDVAASYSGTSETYEAKTIRTAEDMNNFLAEIGYDQYNAVEENGKFVLYENNEYVAQSDTAQGIYEEFCWYEGVGEGDANYKVYLNLKNPLEVDAGGRNWDQVGREFSPKLYDAFKSFTEEERAALQDLAEWEDFGVFKDELAEAVMGKSKGTNDAHYNALASAYLKSGFDVNALFDLAASGFSEQTMREVALGYLNTRDYAQRAKEQGYDGVIFKNIHDNGGYSNGSEGASTVAVAFDSNQIKSVANENPSGDSDIRYSLSIKHTDGSVEELADARSLTKEQAVGYLRQAKSGKLQWSTYIPVRKDTPQVIIDTLAQVEEKIENRSLVMQVRKAQQSMATTKSVRRSDKYGSNTRGHSLSAEQIVEIVNNLDDPSAVIYQTNRKDASGNPAQNNVAVFVEYNNNGTEGVAVIEFDSSLSPESVGTEFGDTSYHTVVTVFEPDIERNGMSFDYAEELLSNPDNILLEIKRRQSEGSAIGKNHPNTSNELPSYDANVAQDGKNVKFSLSESVEETKDPRSYAEIQEEQQKLYQRERDITERKRVAQNDPELLQAMDDYHNLFTEMKELLSKRRSETATPEELDRIEEIKKLREERLQRVAELQESLGLNALTKEAEEIRVKKEELRVASDEAWAREGAEKENKAIEKAGISAPEYFRKKALKAFKTTTNFNEAGYLLPDGKMLNFSGGERNHRFRDHREIGEIYEATQGAKALNRFMSDGNIRIMAESPGIDITSGVEPTREQYLALRKFVNANGVEDGRFYVDFSGTDGRTIGKYEYNGRIFADRIINDIKYFYQTGTVRESSGLTDFLSLSYDGEQPFAQGDFRVFGKDMRVPKPAVEAPVAEATVSESTQHIPVTEEELFPDDLAPTEAELDNLLQQKEVLESRMNEAMEAEDLEAFTQINTEYDSVMSRIEALEQEISENETSRADSLIEADIPPEMEAPYYATPEATELTKKATDDIVRRLRGALQISNNQVADARDIIERYRTHEIQTRDELISELQRNFGNYTEKGRDEALAEVQSFLRSTKVNVDEFIRRDIRDYPQLMRSNFGKIRFSKDGRGVDSVYAELNELWPHYFPESPENNDSPSSLLLQMFRVANMDVNTEESRSVPLAEIESAADAIINSINDFRYNQEQQTADRYSRESFNSLMREADRYAPPATEEALPDDYAPVSSEASKSEAESAQKPAAETKSVRKALHEGILADVKARFAENGYDFDDVLKKAKNLSTFATVDNSPQRVMEKALGYKEGQLLSDITVNQVAQNETEGIKWLNSYTDRKDGLLAQISKQYGIKPGSKESAAAQMYAEGFYVGENNDIIEYGNKELAADFPDARVRQNIKGLANDPRIRKIYDETLAMINESRTRNAYPEIPRLENYFLHFRAMDDTFSRLGLPFNPNDIRAKDLPTDLNGVTADLKPGQPYFASAMHRMGKRTSFDLLGGLERYLSSAKNQIYHIDDIQTLRALRNYVADTYGQANGLEGLDVLSEEEAQDRIEKVYNSHLSTFAKFLNEEANILAGKTALIDRGLEGIIGRRGITFLDTVNKQVGSNMVGFNISSSLTNFIPVAQTFAKTNKADFVKAFAQTVSNKVGSIFGKSDAFAENSPVVIRRKGADRFYRTPWQKAGDAGYVLMSAVDDISTELIARTKYNEFIRNGMDSQKAHYETDKWVSRLMGDRSLGQMPQLYNSRMLGLVTKFQLEVRNQLDSQFYDTIQEAKVSNEHIQNGLERNLKTAAKVGSTFFQLAVVQHLFGKAFESVAGYNPAFDIISVLTKMFGWDDDEESEDTFLDNIEEGFLELLGDLPYASTLTGGRIPIESALPIEQFVNGKDKYGNEKSRWETLAEAAPYYVLPGGYGQLKKTAQGLSMFSDEHPIAGSYTDSGNLRFPVEDTFSNRVQAGIFGQYASENARDYFDNERSPLKEKQIQEYIDVDIPIRDYWEYREGLSGLENLSEQADYINSLDLPIDKKNILINNLAGRKEPIDMTRYDDYASFEEFDFAVKNPEKYEIAQAVGGFDAYMKYQEDMKGMKLEEKADYVARLNLTVGQKNALINGETERKEPIDLTGYENYSGLEELDFAREYPENYAIAKAVGGYKNYAKYSDDLYDIKADKDANGDSISGSRKQKYYDYIYSLNIPEVQKHILFKKYYPSEDTYNYEIIDYLNEREDITYDDMVNILKKLGFDVDAKGNITW